MHSFGKFLLYAVSLFDLLLDSFFSLEDITLTSWLYFISDIVILYSVSSCSLDLKVMSPSFKISATNSKPEDYQSRDSEAIVLLPITIAGLLNKF